ncbi:restriction endonuclease subunit S [Trichococcus collinsii]|uniref:Type I restriction modification DNA specificity domain-containing protein n=1 Tax=Trichococcus collinsii TaxID=157076 RepID=A0AB37ZWQ3_9LACT|nr:restriction endonuclease subunit S [Trichococcus collinsii]CZQ82316.1 restriction endonuclease type i hsds [Trichococcus collinsii]SDZ87601.1 Type I restriction modification DNA specificity domain-containing protein [Trichococcus collinsii]
MVLNKQLHHELKSIFGTKLDTKKFDEVSDLLNSGKILFSSDHSKLIQKILENKIFETVLAPTLNLGTTLAWLENKKIIAYEKNSSEYELSKQLFGNRDINIVNRDFYNEEIKDKFDVIIYTTPWGNVKKDNGKTARLEKEYINKALDCLNDDGLLVVTVPSSVLENRTWQDTRQKVIDNYSLEMTIYLGNAFDGTLIDWYILVISNNPQTDNVYYAKLNNNFDEISNKFISSSHEFLVESKDLQGRWDIKYMSPENATLRAQIYSKNTVKLGEIAEIISGIHVQSNERSELGDYMILSPKLIDNNMLIDNDDRYFFCNLEAVTHPKVKSAILQKNDIIIRLLGNLNWCRYDGSKKIIASPFMAIIRTKPEYSKYLEFFFESTTGQEYLKKQTNLFSIGRGVRSLTIADIKQFVVPNVDTLETATKFQEMHNPIIKVKTAFTAVGWDVREEIIIGNTVIDIGLYYNEELKGAIEVKNYKSSDLSKEKNFNIQFDRLKKKLGNAKLLVYLNEELYEYVNRQLIRLPEIPSPTKDLTHLDNSAYVEEKAKHVVIKQLQDDAVSISDNYINESIWIKRVFEKLERIEAKVDDMYQILIKMSEQIASYQSLIERQIDRAIGPEEIERIIQSFSDECSERIITQLNRNYTEQECMIEVEKLKASLGEKAWNKMDYSSQTFLFSSKLMYNKLISMGNVVDYSGVCLLVTKALEVEMSNRFFKQYVAFLTERYPGKANLLQWPTTLLNSYGKKMNQKNFTLGSVAYILCFSPVSEISDEQKGTNQSRLLEYTKSELFIEELDDETILEKLMQYAEWIEEVRKDYRNPSAHTNQLKKVDAENCFALVTDVEKILKTMLDAFKA